jgi:hypothetical protein
MAAVVEGWSGGHQGGKQGFGAEDFEESRA